MSTGWVLLAMACGAQTVVPTPDAPLPPDSVVQTMQAQAALDAPEVAPYLHVEVPSNLPLTVYAVPDLAEGVAGLVVGGQAVRAVPPAEARVHLLARESLDGPRVRIRLAIPLEGVVGHVDVELSDYVWTAVAAEVTER